MLPTSHAPTTHQSPCLRVHRAEHMASIFGPLWQATDNCLAVKCKPSPQAVEDAAELAAFGNIDGASADGPPAYRYSPPMDHPDGCGCERCVHVALVVAKDEFVRPEPQAIDIRRPA